MGTYETEPTERHEEIYMSNTEREKKTATGVCVEIAQRPGSEWVEFHVDTGGKYPVRVATKLPPLVEAGKAVGGEIATWTYTEVESDKINEKSGKPYLNRYLEKVEVGTIGNGSAAVRPVTSTGPEERMTKEDWAAKDAAIHKMACVKVAAGALTHTLPSDPTDADLTRFLERVLFLVEPLHRVVLAERDDPAGDDIPFD